MVDFLKLNNFEKSSYKLVQMNLKKIFCMQFDSAGLNIGVGESSQN